MGFNFHAVSFIGMKFDEKKCWLPPVKVKAFDHGFDESYKFHPKTGEPLWEEEENAIEAYEDFEDGMSTLGGYPVIEGIRDDDYYVRGNCYAVLLQISSGSSNGGQYEKMIAIPENLQEITLKFINTMKSIGFWDESQFGLWTMLTGG